MTMRTVGWALTWEYWRRGTIWLVLAIAGLVIACTGLLYAPLLLHHWPPLLRSPCGTRCGAHGVHPPATRGVGDRVRLPRLGGTMCCPFRRPCWSVARWPTALWQRCCIYWIVAIVLGSLFQADWPLLAPACWTATVYVLLQSLVWQAGRSRGLLMLLMASVPGVRNAAGS